MTQQDNAHEQSRMSEAEHLTALLQPHDAIHWIVKWKVSKYQGDWTGEQIAAGQAPAPYEVINGDGNLLVTNGALLLWQALCGATPTFFSNANARLGVGDSNAVAAVGQTDLQAATNKTRVAMDSSYPKVGSGGGASADNHVLFQSTFGAAVAEWGTGWQEWALFNAASGATSMLNRKVINLGVKGTNTTWVLQVDLSLA